MKSNIVYPTHTSKEIDAIYYGTDETKGEDFRNPAFRIFSLCVGLLVVVWVVGLFISVKTGVLFAYETFLNEQVVRFWNLCNVEPDAGIKATLFVLIAAAYLFMVFLPIFILPYKLINIIGNAMMKNFRRNGQIYVSPLNRIDYCRISSLYKEAERIIPHLRCSFNLVDIYIEDEDTVRICIHDQLISKEEKYRFKGLAKEIFKPDVLDFSIIDTEMERLMVKDGKSDKLRGRGGG